MASQGEREPGVLEMDEESLESMVQDGISEQEMLVVQDELPQTNPEPEMGAAAAAAYDTSPPPLRQNPPILLERSAVDMILQAMEANTKRMEKRMKSGMDGNAQQMEKKMEANLKENAKQMKEETNGMKEEMREMRGEMQKMGHGLQVGIMALAYDEMWTAGGKMATPRAETNELGGSATAVRPAVEAGEDRVIR